MSKVSIHAFTGIENMEPKEAITILLADLTRLALEVNRRQVIHLCGPRLMMPRAGMARVYLVSPVTTAGSDGSNYQTIQILRNGQAASGILQDTRNVEVVAYVPYFLGTFAVAQGEVLALSITSVGTISPTMMAADMTLRAELNLREA